MKGFNVLLISSFFAIMNAHAVFGTTNHPHTITAEELIKLDKKNNDLKFACSAFDPRCYQ